ncbi:histidine phosphatase family protein [Candidatus Bathyarchaeota archaeon]|nr:histidine phosphatase family protein [Candidatus Bathyarchaeota archaeon]
MVRIHFVRHGESEENVLRRVTNRSLGSGLTTRGRNQAAELSVKLRNLRVERIFSSPLLRAVQTAEILSDLLHAPVETVEALREYDCGIIEGKSDAPSWNLYDRVAQDWLRGLWESRIEDGENFLDIKARVIPFVEEIVPKYNGSSDSVVIVGHGGLYRHMLPLILENISFGFPFKHPIGNTDVVIAESSGQSLVCVSWCGVVPSHVSDR